MRQIFSLLACLTALKDLLAACGSGRKDIVKMVVGFMEEDKATQAKVRGAGT
jgi:hypothetical protein